MNIDDIFASLLRAAPHPSICEAINSNHVPAKICQNRHKGTKPTLFDCMLRKT